MAPMQLDRPSLVLGGGGGRGLAHIGAWRALQESGIIPARVIGSSAGALIGACIAAGLSWRTIADHARALAGGSLFSINARVISQGTRSPSLLRDEPLRDLIRSVLPVRHFADLQIPFTVNAVDLTTGELVWFGTGGRMDVSLPDAIYASCALPVVYPPALIHDRYFVDGGVIDPLPVARARELGAEEIVAVDLSPCRDAGRRRGGLVDTYCRVFEILRAGSAGAALEPAPDLLHIDLALSDRDTFDMGRGEDLIATGYERTREQLSGRTYVPEAEVTAARHARPAPRRSTNGWLPSWLVPGSGSLARPALTR